VEERERAELGKDAAKSEAAARLAAPNNEHANLSVTHGQ
jgi:hypothetical protein